MSVIPFHESELNIKKMHKCGGLEMMRAMGISDFPEMEPIFQRPVPEKENLKLWFDRKQPCYLPTVGWVMCDVNVFRPRIHPDNVACHLIFDGEPLYEYTTNQMPGFFDLNWVYVPVAGGSTVAPGKPKIEDMSEWEKYISMPDLDALDWDRCENNNKDYLDTPQHNQLGILCGFWERLMSLMDVEGAAVALINEDQSEGLHRFFDQYADFLIDYITRMKKICDIDGVLIHDDWGHQNGAFFSLDTAMEMFVPYLKRVTDAVHKLGMYFELHSCGKNETLVPAYIAAGVDLWCPQVINDVKMLAEKYKDAPITFGMQGIDVSADAAEEEQRQAAVSWFETYKDYRVVPAFMNSTPTIAATLYKLSREYYNRKNQMSEF